MATAANRALIQIAVSKRCDVQQLLAQIADLVLLDVEDEASADELLAKHGELFSFWACVIDHADADDDYQDLVPLVWRLFHQVGMLASLEAFKHVPLEARMHYVDVVTKTLKAEMQSDAAPPPENLMIYLSIEGWLRTDVLDLALKSDDGLIGTVCQLVSDETKLPNSKTLELWLSLLADVAKNIIMRTQSGDNIVRFALSRGVLRAAIRAANHPHASQASGVQDIARHLLHMLANIAPVIVKALEEGTETRRLADSVLESGCMNPAKSELRKLLALEKLDKIARTTVAAPGTGTSSANPSGPTLGNNMCRNCSSMEATLKCSKCLQAYYCNKVCQQKDWQTHKKTCLSKEDGAQIRDSSTIPTRFFLGYLLINEDQVEMDVMRKRFEVCSTKAIVTQPLELQEVVVALNLDTLTHTVLFLKDVRKWQNIPAWIVDEAKTFVLELVAFMHAKLLPGMVLVVVRAPGSASAFSVYRTSTHGVQGEAKSPAPRRSRAAR